MCRNEDMSGFEGGSIVKGRGKNTGKDSEVKVHLACTIVGEESSVG